MGHFSQGSHYFLPQRGRVCWRAAEAVPPRHQAPTWRAIKSRLKHQPEGGSQSKSQWGCTAGTKKVGDEARMTVCELRWAAQGYRELEIGPDGALLGQELIALETRTWSVGKVATKDWLWLVGHVGVPRALKQYRIGLLENGSRNST